MRHYKKALFSVKYLGHLLLYSGLIGVTHNAFAVTQGSSIQDPVYIKYVNDLKNHPYHNILMFVGQADLHPYTVYVHSQLALSLLKSDYTTDTVNNIIKGTEATRKIKVQRHPWGIFVQAASFASQDMATKTNYDAIWVRDSVWGYLALESQDETRSDAHQVLMTLWDYMATPVQIARMKAVIIDPTILNGSDGQMKAVHIRFNSASQDFADVMENGIPQPWTHKQNDALGLFLDSIFTEINNGRVKGQDWSKDRRLDALIYLVGYLDKAQFYKMEDSGAWEEDSRLNTSSVGLVTSALENLQRIIDHPTVHDKDFVHALQDRAKQLNASSFVSSPNLSRLVDLGYKRIYQQLEQGGESPDYNKTDSRYRQADAALLNLIYPARLSRLTLEHKKRVLDIVAPLMGDIGIRRYFKDNYQSANFWFHNIKTDTDSASHAERKKQFIPGTEAQWFFDSWYAKAAFMIYHESKDPHYRAVAIRSMNRALAQITGKDTIGANGKVVSAMALPESYNFIADQGQLWESPSPITPLNWAKASMTLMLQEATKNLH
ncbi:glycoside hydrolase family 15 protein [Commensalibacter oyaizuii]|uniref:Glycoside hydrolase family 15 protein n=1 Tax=Commensalibacter oyaizuii TaxID=3043873 RepID=A0ABT6Q305_9PROT|nr:glycoside hydrolase family 15 protein [Commensalibacter sp. TBRC 16381]MDI2091521.1 glycoside hydrolase family 15 protein [Commensalibacter sp. TBRC 16381]